MDEDETDKQLTVTTDAPMREAGKLRPTMRSELVEVCSRNGGSIAAVQLDDGSLHVAIHAGVRVHVVFQ